MFVVGGLRRNRSSSSSSPVAHTSNPPSPDWFSRGRHNKEAMHLTAGSSSRCSSAETSVSSSYSIALDRCDSQDSARLPTVSAVSSRDESLEEILEEDTFFDCKSHASSPSLLCLSYSDNNLWNGHPAIDDDEIALFRDGMCVYADGRPAHIPAGNSISNVPSDYLHFCGGNQNKARQMWKVSQQWRRDQQTYKVLQGPNKQFFNAKRYYPSCYHGICKQGRVSEFSFPGQMDPVALLPNKKAADEVLEHYMFMQEYISNCLYTDTASWDQLGSQAPRVEDTSHRLGLINVVIDVKNTGINLLSGCVFSFLSRMIDTTMSHYPAMINRCFILNAPFWFAGVFAAIKPLLPDTLPIEIVSEANTLSTLKEYFDDDQIPIEYGGSSVYPLHKHPFELRLCEAIEEASSSKARKVNHASDFSPPGDCCTASDLIKLPATSAALLCSNGPCARNASTPSFSEPTFFVDGDMDGDLVLTPQPPIRDCGSIAQSLWNAIRHGFKGCGRWAS